jgi:hypothetical protein
MGRQFVEKMKESQVRVFTVNRGRTYWCVPGNPSVKADRRNRSDYKEKISQFISGVSDVAWLGVVDFCAFKPKDVEDSLPAVLFDPKIFPVYIFISTDSVYEVIPGIDGFGGPIVESLTDKFGDGELMKDRDKYGFKKLLTERSLFKRSPMDQSLICLRLPDVLGQFDDTDRFFKYVLAIEKGLPAIQTPDKNRLVSFVYVGDIVDSLAKALNDASRKKVVRESINLACKEQGNMEAFLACIGSALREEKLVLSPKGKSWLPSVEQRHQCLCLEKAKSLLGFEPTRLESVIRQTVDWFLENRMLFSLWWQ